MTAQMLNPPRRIPYQDLLHFQEEDLILAGANLPLETGSFSPGVVLFTVGLDLVFSPAFWKPFLPVVLLPLLKLFHT